MEKVLWLFKRVKSGLRISMEISCWMMHHAYTSWDWWQLIQGINWEYLTLSNILKISSIEINLTKFDYVSRFNVWHPYQVNEKILEIMREYEYFIMMWNDRYSGDVYQLTQIISSSYPALANASRVVTPPPTGHVKPLFS